jgi:hypothetical protein
VDNDEINDAQNQPIDGDLLDYLSESDTEDGILHLKQSNFS